jgi:hypothetical protein
MDLEQSRDFRGGPSGGKHAEDFRVLRLLAGTDRRSHLPDTLMRHLLRRTGARWMTAVAM